MLVSDVPQLRHTESITVLTFVITAFRDEKMYHGKQFCYLADGAENNFTVLNCFIMDLEVNYAGKKCELFGRRVLKTEGKVYAKALR